VEFQTTAVPVETCRGLLPACLTMGPDWLPDFVYLQEGLTRIIRCTTDEFPQLAKKLLDDAGAAQSVECEALLGALAELVSSAAEECSAHFGELLVTLLQNVAASGGTQVDGVGKCLKVLTERLGDQLGELAGQMMDLYVRILHQQQTASGGMQEETLLAVASLVAILGSRLHSLTAGFWPALIAAVDHTDDPAACAVALDILSDRMPSLGSRAAATRRGFSLRRAAGD